MGNPTMHNEKLLDSFVWQMEFDSHMALFHTQTLKYSFAVSVLVFLDKVSVLVFLDKERKHSIYNSHLAVKFWQVGRSIFY